MLIKRHADCTYSIQNGLIINPFKIGDNKANPYKVDSKVNINVPAKSKHKHTLSIQYYDGQTVHMKVRNRERAIEIFTQRYRPIHRIPGLYNITAAKYVNRITGDVIDLVNNSN